MVFLIGLTIVYDTTLESRVVPSIPVIYLIGQVMRQAGLL